VDFVTDYLKLKRCLDFLTADYGHEYRNNDPVGLVHGYVSPRDREITGFIVSALAYGTVIQIRKSAGRVLDILGESPADSAKTLSPRTALDIFQGFKHRWTDSGDIAFLVWIAGDIIGRYGSFGDFVQTLHNPGEKTIAGVMARFSAWVQEHYRNEFSSGLKKRGISYLIPSPASGSACKRLALYFRWMVRRPDGVDMGIWDFIDPSQLIVPVDTHMARIGRFLGLTDRRTADWGMALELTESFCRINPEDPLRYDFALVKLGTLKKCVSSANKKCVFCMLRKICSEAS